MSKPQSDFVPCPRRDVRMFVTAASCNGARDCLDSTTIQQGFKFALCNSLAWVRPDPRRVVEIFNAQRTERLARVTHAWRTETRLSKCGLEGFTEELPPGSNAGPDPFTIDVPGLTDILKAPSLNSPALKKERYDRWKSRKSPVPDALSWIPPLLTKLDNAQDLLFTALALLWPILKRLPRPFLGPFGILLTINDLLNLTT